AAGILAGRPWADLGVLPTMAGVEASQLSTHAGADVRVPDDGIAIVVLTHNRVDLLRKCVENVLLRTSEATREIVIWDNASPDGTAEYLRALDDPRIRVVISEANIGQNAYARAFRMTSATYFIELDDDVVNAPEHWDAMMLDAFKK